MYFRYKSTIGPIFIRWAILTKGDPATIKGSAMNKF